MLASPAANAASAARAATSPVGRTASTARYASRATSGAPAACAASANSVHDSMIESVAGRSRSASHPWLADPHAISSCASARRPPTLIGGRRNIRRTGPRASADVARKVYAAAPARFGVRSRTCRHARADASHAPDSAAAYAESRTSLCARATRGATTATPTLRTAASPTPIRAGERRRATVVRMRLGRLSIDPLEILEHQLPFIR